MTAPSYAGRHVPGGICHLCDGPLIIDRDDLHACCPCGACRIPRKFFRAAMNEAPLAADGSGGA